VIRDPKCHSRSHPQRLVRPTEIVERDIEGDSGQMAFQLLAKTVAERGDPPTEAYSLSLGRSAEFQKEPVNF